MYSTKVRVVLNKASLPLTAHYWFGSQLSGFHVEAPEPACDRHSLGVFLKAFPFIYSNYSLKGNKHKKYAFNYTRILK